MLLSDVGQRLPAFREMYQTMQSGVRHGYFEGLPFDIDPLLEGMQPVGLDDEGTLVLPARYDPQDGPAVLMLQPDETERKINVGPWNDAEMATAEHSFSEVGITIGGLRHLGTSERVALANRAGMVVSP